MGRGGLFVELGAVVLGLAVAARIAHRIGISPVPLYVGAGLLLGRGGVAPLVTAQGFLEVGAEIGVILLLLLLGVEYSGAELVTGLRSTAPVAALDLLLNLGVGVAAGLMMGFGPVGALLVGGITYASSSGIVAKLLRDLGWLGNREVPAVLRLLVAEDLAMVVLLPAIGIVLAGTGGEAPLRVVGAVAVAAIVLLAATRYGEHVSRLFHHRSPEVVLLGVFGLTLLIAGIAELAEVSAAIGAFMVGIAISGPIRDVARELLEPLRDLFAAVFFIFFSLQIDPASIPPVLVPALALAAITGATKYATGIVLARRQDLGPGAQRRTGVLLLARGEFSIIIAGLGVGAGFDPELGALAATYVLLLAVVGPVLAQLVDRGSGGGALPTVAPAGG